MAMELHPDKTGGDTVKLAKYQLVSHAYATLIDVEQRKAYDRRQGYYSGSNYAHSSHSRANSSFDRMANAPIRPLDPNIPFNEKAWYAAHYPEEEVIFVDPSNVSSFTSVKGAYQQYYINKARSKTSTPVVNSANKTYSSGAAANSVSGGNSKCSTTMISDHKKPSVYHQRQKKREYEAKAKESNNSNSKSKSTSSSKDEEYKVDTPEEHRKKMQQEQGHQCTVS